MTTACPGRCNTSYRNTPDNGAQPVPGEPVWCPGCAGIIRTALRALPTAYRALDAVPYMTPRAPSDDLATHVSGSRERPSPGPGVDLRYEMSRTMCSWEDDLRVHLRVRAAHLPDGSERALQTAVRFLNGNWERAIGRPECSREFGDETWSLYLRTLRMVKNDRPRRKLSIPCPRCDVRAMVQHEGIANQPWYTECLPDIGGCGVIYSEQEMTWAAQVRVAVRA